MEFTPITAIALLGGVLPALIWLFFWLLEDRCEPEPKRFIFFVFVGGMLSVFVALKLELLASNYIKGVPLIFTWAAIEEFAKFGVAYFLALRWSVFDEPLDAIIYLVTAALGFSALENTLFLIHPIDSGDVLKSVITGDLRFVGASLLHTLASATIGISIALSFAKPAVERRLYAFVGVILAVALHTLFNFFILRSGFATFWIFLLVWLGIVALLLLVERVKQPARDYC